MIENFIQGGVGWSSVFYLIIACFLVLSLFVIFRMFYNNGRPIKEDDLYDDKYTVLGKYESSGKLFYLLRRDEDFLSEKIIVCWAYKDKGFQLFGLNTEATEFTRIEKQKKLKICEE